MHPQLQAVVDEFEHAQIRLRSLARAVPEEAWPRRPDQGRWSVAECVSHINLTSAAYVPLLRKSITNGRLLDGPSPERHRRDVVGWLLWKTAGPPVRLRVKTTALFIPQGTGAPLELINEFDRLAKEQIACVREADGLPLGRIKVTSPFNARLKYNLFACLTILPRHQHRHLWQAEQAWRALRKSRR
jgi:DinB superfamily